MSQRLHQATSVPVIDNDPVLERHLYSTALPQGTFNSLLCQSANTLSGNIADRPKLSLQPSVASKQQQAILFVPG